MPGTSTAFHYFDYSPSASEHIYTVWGLTSRILMVTACIAYSSLPDYIDPLQQQSIKDPLILGYFTLGVFSKL